MNILDIAFLVIAGYLCVRGTLRGFVVEGGSILGALLAFFLATTYTARLLPHIQQHIPDPGVAGVVSYLAIFFGAFVLVTLLAQMISVFIPPIAQTLNRLLGGVIGLAKAGLICIVLLLVLSWYLPRADFLVQSRLVPYVEQGASYVRPYFTRQIEALPKPAPL